GYDAADHADERRARKRSAQLPRFGEPRNSRRDPAVAAQRRGCKSLLETHQHFAEPICTDHYRQVTDAVAQNVAPEREAIDAVDLVDADRRDQHAEEQADERVGERAAAERD